MQAIEFRATECYSKDMPLICLVIFRDDLHKKHLYPVPSNSSVFDKRNTEILQISEVAATTSRLY